MQFIKISIILVLVCFSTLLANDLKPEFNGQLSAWGIGMTFDGEGTFSGGVRYFPQLQMKLFDRQPQFFVDSEVILNTLASADSNGFDGKIDLYRLKLRFATPRTETQVGLQKINFGPAQILRSLMWFDTMNPMDPLRLTDGVYGVRFRSNFMNNSNLWLWGLYGNDKPKGMDYLGSTNVPEFGGRFQCPVPFGEMAMSVHTREVDYQTKPYRESKIAIDGRWDWVVGSWFESVMQYCDSDILPYQYTFFTTLGMDYTFGIGNGLYFLAAHMSVQTGTSTSAWSNSMDLSAYMFSYPIGLFDSVTFMGYYMWDLDKYLQYVGWQRAYNNLTLDLSVFYFPEIADIGGLSVTGSGYGTQLTLIYNH